MELRDVYRGQVDIDRNVVLRGSFGRTEGGSDIQGLAAACRGEEVDCGSCRWLFPSDRADVYHNCFRCALGLKRWRL